MPVPLKLSMTWILAYDLPSNRSPTTIYFLTGTQGLYPPPPPPHHDYAAVWYILKRTYWSKSELRWVLTLEWPYLFRFSCHHIMNFYDSNTIDFETYRQLLSPCCLAFDRLKDWPRLFSMCLFSFSFFFCPFAIIAGFVYFAPFFNSWIARMRKSEL